MYIKNTVLKENSVSRLVSCIPDVSGEGLLRTSRSNWAERPRHTPGRCVDCTSLIPHLREHLPPSGSLPICHRQKVTHYHLPPPGPTITSLLTRCIMSQMLAKTPPLTCFPKSNGETNRRIITIGFIRFGGSFALTS